ncbi:MAG: hypothetical protein IPK73_03855 [Candidatus Obscuribacter sp.]|nr:hypothetical protein [Candidatus Obscuribacter sp.]MBK9281060.1 hypothetical protein [Candidatus Obscuribacter sp.]
MTNDSERSSIDEALDKEFESLPNTSLHARCLSQLGSPLSREDDKGGQFADFIDRYYSLLEATKVNFAAAPDAAHDLKVLRQKHSVLCDCADIVLAYLARLSNVSPVVSGVMRRLSFRHLSYLNSATRSGILDYKTSLPKVGLLFYPNADARDFLVEALNGVAQVDDMEPGKLLERTWVGRPYDFHRYQKELRARVEALLLELPEDLIQLYPSRAWLEQEFIDNLQYQFALVELLKRREWDLIFLGANEVPLGLLLYDMDPALLPPIVFLCHGMLAGDPVMDFWFRFDKTLARGAVEKTYFLKAGVESDRIVDIGSPALDAFPSSDALSERRRQARVKLGLSSKQSVFIYALTYDVYRADVSAQVINLILESLRRARMHEDLHEPVLFLKYHPSPAGDPTFSYSRNQYPLPAFMALNEAGFSVRILPELDGYLPAADCFIAHESSTLFQALEAGVPTISIRFNDGNTLPTMGFSIYEGSGAHRLRSLADGASVIGLDLHELSQMSRTDAFEQSRSAWSKIFHCGRTEALSCVVGVVQEMIANSKKR